MENKVSIKINKWHCVWCALLSHTYSWKFPAEFKPWFSAGKWLDMERCEAWNTVRKISALFLQAPVFSYFCFLVQARLPAALVGSWWLQLLSWMETCSQVSLEVPLGLPPACRSCHPRKFWPSSLGVLLMVKPCWSSPQPSRFAVKWETNFILIINWKYSYLASNHKRRLKENP